MDLSNFVSGAGASRWVPTVAGPKMIGHQVRQQKEQQLLQEAASLLPDSAALTKALMEYDLPYADLAPIQSQLTGLTHDYMENYQKSPFNAFSKEMKDKIRGMQLMVQDPKLKQLSQENALFKKHTEKVLRDDQLGNNFNVRDGRIAVYRKSNSGGVSRVWIDPKDRQQTDQLFDISGDIDVINNNIGLGGLDEKYTVDMTPEKELQTKIADYFKSVGHTTLDSFDNGTGERIKTNRPQLDAVIKTLLGGGLSQADKNMLYSKYYTEHMGQEGVSKESADKWIAQHLVDLSNTKEIGSDQAIKNPDGSTAGGGILKNAQGTTPFEMAAAGQSGEYSVNDIFNNDSKATNRVLGGGALTDFYSRSEHKVTDENGDSVPRLTLSDNEYFKQGGQKIMVRDNITGEFKNIDYIKNLADAAVGDDRKGAGVIKMITDPQTGMPVSAELNERIMKHDFRRNGVPPEFRKYIKGTGQIGPDGNEVMDLSQGLFVVAHYNIADRQSLNGGNQSISQFGSDMEAMGYQSHDMDNGEASRYQLHNKAGLDPNHFYYNSDQVYKVPVFIPVPSMAAGREASGGKVLQSQQGSTMGTMEGNGFSSKAFTLSMPSQYNQALSNSAKQWSLNSVN